MNLAHSVLMRANIKTKPPKHMRTRGDGKPGQKFNLERLEQLCAKYGIDPAEIAVAGLDPTKSPDLKDKERIDIALRLMEYTYAKRKAVEVGGSDGGPVKLVIEWAESKSSE